MCLKLTDWFTGMFYFSFSHRNPIWASVKACLLLSNQGRGICYTRDAQRHLQNGLETPVTVWNLWQMLQFLTFIYHFISLLFYKANFDYLITITVSNFVQCVVMMCTNHGLMWENMWCWINYSLSLHTLKGIPLFTMHILNHWIHFFKVFLNTFLHIFNTSWCSYLDQLNPIFAINNSVIRGSYLHLPLFFSDQENPDLERNG